MQKTFSLLRNLGIKGDMRVRHRGDEARIEVPASEFGKVRDAKETIVSEFNKLGFAQVTLELTGYRRGSLLTDVPPDLELLS